MRFALVCYSERCIEVGTVECYADAARRLGVTIARMAQVWIERSRRTRSKSESSVSEAALHDFGSSTGLPKDLTHAPFVPLR